ncbi:hypothetical protein IDJ81_13715 [Tsuneonella flava]|uniref:Calx-beta domain-containing protein n=1 Tax=Tsuneonella flava TaxID=2055955 RepID=A0ABX7KAU1_9SPHN|nr:Calx-beta domain-containing protein [Tsuneonella flava]QSB44354.1 hypothetical protein IDJ81_13715 [Tsuneonella flava]
MTKGLLLKSSVFAVAVAVAGAGIGQQSVHAGETINYTYDSLGRLIAAKSTGTVNNNEIASYCYDEADNREFAKTDTTGTAFDCSSLPTPTPTPTPSVPSISIIGGSANEGDPITFTVKLSASHTSSISVNYATAIGTAVLADFTAVSGTLTFSSGQTTKTISVSTIEDTKIERTEIFYVNLSNPTGGATIPYGQASGRIRDNGDGGCPLC